MKKIDHARHNESLNDKLIAETKPTHYKDWIITTAFYAAIHFIDHRLFPCTYFNSSVTNLDAAYQLMKQQHKKISKHRARGWLVNSKLPKIGAQYDFLCKQCHLARYVNYNVSDNLAKQAKNYLNQIKTECAPTS